MKQRKKEKRHSLNLSAYFTAVIMGLLTLTTAASALIAFLMDFFFGRSLNVSEATWIVIFAIVLGSALAIFTGSKFLRPIKKLSEAMQKVAQRDFTIRLATNTKIKEIREIYDNFNLMTKELGTAEILQTDFVSGVSHEFKTPINAIEGYATLLQEEGLSKEETGEYIEKIMFNTRRLSELVGNILLLSKLENQAIPAAKSDYRADEQVRSAILLLEPKWTAKNIDFDIDLSGISCKGYDRLTMHIWVNLIDNAVKFSDEGGIIRLRLFSEGDFYVFAIEDNGCGIAEEDSRHIFDKFFQSDTSRRHEGSGLGLSLVKRIADICGGTVTVESKLNAGTKFTVRLPIGCR